MALSNYGEQFAANCLRKFYARAIAPAVTNSDYEGQIKKKGNKLNILSFDDVTLSDYSVGSDMNVEHPNDREDQLTIDQKKYYNFDIDRVDEQFTYVEDEDSTLIENAAKGLEQKIDSFILGKVSEVKAGHRVGSDATAADTNLAGLTSDGVLTFTSGVSDLGSSIEGKGVYINKIDNDNDDHDGWFKIKTFTNSTNITIQEWNDDDYDQGSLSADDSAVTFEAVSPVEVTSGNVYDKLTELAEKLDQSEIPATDRHITVPAWFKKTLVRASELQPDIAMYHNETIVNGKVGRVAGFDIHLAPGQRISTSTGTDGTKGYEILANHSSFITFAHKFSESRVVDAEKQFAKLYQGLNLYGAKVATERRKAGAMLYAKQ